MSISWRSCQVVNSFTPSIGEVEKALDQASEYPIFIQIKVLVTLLLHLYDSRYLALSLQISMSTYNIAIASEVLLA